MAAAKRMTNHSGVGLAEGVHRGGQRWKKKIQGSDAARKKKKNIQQVTFMSSSHTSTKLSVQYVAALKGPEIKNKVLKMSVIDIF